MCVDIRTYTRHSWGLVHFTFRFLLNVNYNIKKKHKILVPSEGLLSYYVVREL